MIDITYIQLQNNSQAVIGQRYRRANCNYEKCYGHMFSFGKISTANDIGQHLRIFKKMIKN